MPPSGLRLNWPGASLLSRSSIAADTLPPTLFQRNRVLTPARQDDLLELLELIAARLAHSDERELRTSPGQTQAALGRAMTYIETHLSERLRVEAIAGLSRTSIRRKCGGGP